MKLCKMMALLLLFACHGQIFGIYKQLAAFYALMQHAVHGQTATSCPPCPASIPQTAFCFTKESDLRNCLQSRTPFTQEAATALADALASKRFLLPDLESTVIDILPTSSPSALTAVKVCQAHPEVMKRVIMQMDNCPRCIVPTTEGLMCFAKKSKLEDCLKDTINTTWTGVTKKDLAKEMAEQLASQAYYPFNLQPKIKTIVQNRYPSSAPAIDTAVIARLTSRLIDSALACKAAETKYKKKKAANASTLQFFYGEKNR